ncbi:hypothetical protein C6502_06365 [Candidatus Poribacteria bacterium]|nr:MAG: hypothetical protein C6502_06365 [Candidatus Poribacteria bacterium]
MFKLLSQNWLFRFGSYKKKVQNVERGRGNPAPTIAVARFLNMSLRFILVTLMVVYSQSTLLATEGKLIEWPPLIWPTLTENLIDEDGSKIIRVYLPPSYDFTDKRYPVIYVLHGFNGTSKSLTRKMRSAMDRMILGEEIQEAIAVFVDGSNRFGGSQYLSSPTIGDYETYIRRDLVNFIDKQYRTIPHRDSRGITGFSMGAYGSMHLSLKYPEVFGVVVAQAGTYDFKDDLIQTFAEYGGVIISLMEPLKQKSGDEFWDALNALADSDALKKVSLPFRNGLAYLAGVASNPDNPPCYLDLPYRLKVGVPPWERDEEVWERIIENDIIHELERYVSRLKQNPRRPVRLNGIKLVHGLEDEIALPRQAEALDQKLTERGIDHEFVTHGGGHTFIAEESLQFMAKHLSFESPPTSPDGAGTASVSPYTVPAYSSGHEIVITYTAEGLIRRGVLTVDIPPDWTPPQDVAGFPGYTTVTSTGIIGDVTFTKQRIQIDIQTLMPDDTITLIYGNGGYDSGVTVPAREFSTFRVSVTATSGGTLTLIKQSPVVDVYRDPWDVNNDGTVGVLDLILVASALGRTIDGVVFGQNPDVNRDGLVNVVDLITVGNHFRESIGSPAAPGRVSVPVSATIKFENPRRAGNRLLLDLIVDTAVPLVGYHIRLVREGLLRIDPNRSEDDVFHLEEVAQPGTLVGAKLGVGHPWFGRTRFATLELEANSSGDTVANSRIIVEAADLVSADGQTIGVDVEPFFMDKLRPHRTGVFSNYPNPFNPETWIPFQLHRDAHVRITIYDVLGREVRGFDLGYLSAGYYKTRERAVYWDGRNDVNEQVASGTYFYRLEAGDFVGTQRMVVLK